MSSISDAIFFILTFVVVYIEVFFLVTFIENRKKFVTRRGLVTLKNYPGVTVIVPCWNEEATLETTMESLFALNYPKDKFKILLIDDGSTDNTWSVMQQFSGYANVEIFHKENGGKHTALNLGLGHVTTEFVGCLDADSLVHPEALVRIMSYFENDPLTMAVAPSVVVNQPKNALQKAQAFEHFITVFMRKMHGFMGAVLVLPGPFSIFRKKVFDDLGPYRHAHNVEDTELAYRMHKHHYKIDDCNDAYVYTNMPATIPKLYKQRLRWIYGIINNTIDYRDVLFKTKYGDFGMLMLPSTIIFLFSLVYMFSFSVYHLCTFIVSKIVQFNVLGLHLPMPAIHLDTFFIPTQFSYIILIFVYLFVILTSMAGKKVVENKWGLSFNVVYYFIVFSIIAPFWVLRAIYNTAFSQHPAWR